MASISTQSSDIPSVLDETDQTKPEPEPEPVAPASGHEADTSATTLPLLRGKMTLAEALYEEDNVLLPLSYSREREDFLYWIYQQREHYFALVSQHLGLSSSETCRFGEFKEWRHGSFNVCVPAYIDNWRARPGKRVSLRLPLPYKVGESKCPGNADEKLRAEAATYVWIEDKCPDIPIPFLWGFGFANGQIFVRPQSTPFSTRIMWYLRRAISSLFGYTLPCPYVIQSRHSVLGHGYLLMDYIETTDADMLSESWDKSHNDHNRELKANFFRDLSRIILRVSQTPMPRIGSWTMDDRGVLSLTNRPLMHHFQSLENEGIPTNISRHLTYTATDAYYNDLLACHDSRIRNQPNSISDEDDGFEQIANIFTMRGLLPYFADRELRHGPFIFNLTDLYRSNILVDKDWHIKYIIDLEWACVLPIEMLEAPYWITNRGIDEMRGKDLQKFTTAAGEFMDIFAEEERSFPAVYGSATYRADMMRKGLRVGNFWYFHALRSTKGMFNLFAHHIQKIFEPEFEPKRDAERFSRTVAPYWAPDAREVVPGKLQDKEKYEEQIRQLFKEAESRKEN